MDYSPTRGLLWIIVQHEDCATEQVLVIYKAWFTYAKLTLNSSCDSRQVFQAIYHAQMLSTTEDQSQVIEANALTSVLYSKNKQGRKIVRRSTAEPTPVDRSQARELLGSEAERRSTAEVMPVDRPKRRNDSAGRNARRSTAESYAVDRWADRTSFWVLSATELIQKLGDFYTHYTITF